MPARIHPNSPQSTRAAASPPEPRGRRPFRDNPPLIILGIVVLLVGFVALIAVADRSVELSPDFLSEVVLYALSVADLTMLVALVFVLARNIIKLLVERRRALPFARFRAKLVLALLGMTIIPAVLVLIVGSELIRNSADRWFSAPVDEILTSAKQIASDYYHDRQTSVSDRAADLARALSAVDLGRTDVRAVRELVAPDVAQKRIGMVEVYRVVTTPGLQAEVLPVVDVAVPALAGDDTRASADRLAMRAVTTGSEARLLESLGDGAELVRAAVPVRDASEAVTGVVVASDYLTGELATHSRRIIEAYEGYTQLRVLKRPLAGVYLSFFLMVTLLIIVSATWMGLYLAKRITRPVHMLADGAREIGAGHLDHRIERETSDEFGSLVDAFNAMAGELAASRRKLEQSRIDLERKTVEAEERRRYSETILERVATGVVSIDPSGRISTVNSAAARLLGFDKRVVGRQASEVFGQGDMQPIGTLLRKAHGGTSVPTAQEIALARDGRELHLAAAATVWQGEGGSVEGTVLVFDDITPLIREQKVAAWRDVARRLAHEIKNPLTPIQLSAERIRRHFTNGPGPASALVDECTSTIVGEVESLKTLVDEFSQFARMPAPRTVPSDLHNLLNEALALYDGLFKQIRIERNFAPAMPQVRVDPEQIRRVVINLVDNAIEALGGAHRRAGADDRPGLIVISTGHDETNMVVRVTVADNGPGIPAADREKLFMPYYSTKRRGSGLGLAIVRRIIAEHGGSIDVTDNEPTGTTFTIELPC